MSTPNDIFLSKINPDNLSHSNIAYIIGDEYFDIIHSITNLQGDRRYCGQEDSYIMQNGKLQSLEKAIHNDLFMYGVVLPELYDKVISSTGTPELKLSICKIPIKDVEVGDFYNDAGINRIINIQCIKSIYIITVFACYEEVIDEYKFSQHDYFSIFRIYKLGG